jgi:hypothetical protein
MRCAPRCRAGALLVCLGGVPVGDRSTVGGLRLGRELALCGPHPLAGREHPGVDALVSLGAGADLEQTQLLGRQRGLGVGVVLLARQQAPKQAGELARAGDDPVPDWLTRGSRPR